VIILFYGKLCVFTSSRIKKVDIISIVMWIIVYSLVSNEVRHNGADPNPILFMPPPFPDTSHTRRTRAAAPPPQLGRQFKPSETSDCNLWQHQRQVCVCVYVLRCRLMIHVVMVVICEAKNYSLFFRTLREGIWPTCFDMLWKWLSRLVSFYLLSLNLAAAAASDYPTPSTYPCEDISNYYTPVKNLGLTGEALKGQLNSIIAPHHSLSYREVTGGF